MVRPSRPAASRSWSAGYRPCPIPCAGRPRGDSPGRSGGARAQPHSAAADESTPGAAPAGRKAGPHARHAPARPKARPSGTRPRAGPRPNPPSHPATRPHDLPAPCGAVQLETTQRKARGHAAYGLRAGCVIFSRCRHCAPPSVVVVGFASVVVVVVGSSGTARARRPASRPTAGARRRWRDWGVLSTRHCSADHWARLNWNPRQAGTREALFRRPRAWRNTK